VFITGAARGIGEHVARLAAARGATVFLAGLEPDRLAALAAELDGGWAACDVTDQAALADAVAGCVALTGRIDTVVANAGIANLGTVAAGDIEALARTIDVNLTGVIRTVSATAAHVRKTRGYYLLVSSAAAFSALPGMAAYCAAKAGVEHFGNVLRLELAGDGVGVGTAHPSWVDTDLVRDARDDLPSFRSNQTRLPWPMNRTVPVEQCAQALVRAIEHQSRRVYVPRAVALVQGLRTLVNGRAFQTAMIRASAGRVGAIDDEVRALGRSFGAHSAGWGSPRADPAPPVRPPLQRSPRRTRLNYERRGAGQPLVLVHGIGHRWQAWTPVMDELARHHDVIAIDLPGFGGSPVPSGGMPRTVAGLAQAVRVELAALGVGRFHMAGNSLGGAVALELAAGGAAASATALSPAGFQTTAEGRRGFTLLTLMRAGSFQPEPVLRRTFARPCARNRAFGAVVVHPSRLDPDRMLGDTLALRRAKGFWPIGWGLRHYVFTDAPAVPVTVAWGDHDRILVPAQAQRARVVLPEARHVSLPGCGHVPMSDNPALVASVILQTTGALTTVDA
jgi:NAD(P)-dependent dehydrogenase (short-subunit alcohol dehydrogenase family)/pimeloyl-ACP methyl ester carboxylesterase